jgi:diguanylate cyclase (GGDEF)-like protein
MRILIAEDDRVTALKLRRALEKLGYVVETVDDGAAAWDRIARGGVDILLSDWMMPELDGLELCRRVRSQPDAQYTYVILLTTRQDREDRLAGLEAGADDFLTKPLDTGELLARLNVARRILAMQEQLRAHAEQLAQLYAAVERQNTLLERQNALLAERAATDGLTGLWNRRHFDEALASSRSYAARHDQPLSLILIDVDQFKAYNDTFGHPAGDEVLRGVAEILRNESRVHDVVARYGGEEFALLLPATHVAAAILVGERLRSAIEKHPWPERPITVSVGVSSADRPSSQPGLVARADGALYAAKQTGRNRVVHHREQVFGPIALPPSEAESLADPRDDLATEGLQDARADAGDTAIGIKPGALPEIVDPLQHG